MKLSVFYAAAFTLVAVVSVDCHKSGQPNGYRIYPGMVIYGGKCVKLDWYRSKNTEGCITECRRNTKCNAFHYKINHGGCVLWACPSPIPEPFKKDKRYNAYTLNKGYGIYPAMMIDSRCAKIKWYRTKKTEACIVECRRDTKCNAFHYKINHSGCALIECPYPIPDPVIKDKRYDAYTFNKDSGNGPTTTTTPRPIVPQPAFCEQFINNELPLPTITENESENGFTPGSPFTDEEMQSALLNTTVPDIPKPLPCSAVFPLTDSSNRGVLKPNWPNAEIPYEIDENFTNEQRQLIIKAIQDVQEKTCLRFPARENHKNWMRIQLNEFPSCGVDSLGVPTNKPYVRMGLFWPGCFNHGTIVHEMLHVAGLAHEHTRHDRDNFVTINWENIREGVGPTYQFCKRNTIATGHRYDYDSVMHYPSWAFQKQEDLETIDARGNAIGQRDGMSQGDVDQINHIYCN